jgi:hypothetical protein
MNLGISLSNHPDPVLSGARSECLKLLLDLQKTSRSVLRFLYEVELVWERLSLNLERSPTPAEPLVDPDLDERVTAFLVAANRFNRLLGNNACVLESTLSKTEQNNIRMLRNMWEHRDEKTILPGGRWDESLHPKNIMWLDTAYGQNWLLVFSLTRSECDLIIGELVSTQRLKHECDHWISLEL